MSSGAVMLYDSLADSGTLYYIAFTSFLPSLFTYFFNNFLP